MNNDDKTIAIVSYITPIGWIIALILRQNENPKSNFSRFHLRQSLGVLSLVFVTGIIVKLLGLVGLGLIANIIGIVSFILWLIGLISAIQGTTKLIPLIGSWSDTTFDFVK